MSPEPEKPAAAEPAPHPPHRRRHWSMHLALSLLALLLIVLLAGMALLRYVQSVEFHERVRRAVVVRLERSTGGQVELQSVSWVLDRLQFQLDGLTIHGRESALAPPLLQVERVRGKLRWRALLPGAFGLRELSVLHPIAHIEVNKDGSSNLPQPLAASQGGKSAQLFRLATDHAELIEGRMDWNDAKFRLNGAAEGLQLELRYHPHPLGPGESYYEGEARVGRIHVQLPNGEAEDLHGVAQFELHRGRAEISSLELSSGQSQLKVNGELRNFASPEVNFSCAASVQLAEAARLLHYPELRGGEARLTGEGSYQASSGEFSLAGKSQATGVGWANPILHLERVNGGFEYVLNRERLEVSSLFASALGGTVTGHMQTRLALDKDGLGTVALQANRLELTQVLAAFSNAELPLGRLPLAGAASGPLQIAWRGDPDDGTLSGEMHVQPMPHSGQLPVSAAVRATVQLRDGTTEIQALDATAPATHLAAHGRLSSDSELWMELHTGNAAELAPIVDAWRGSRAEALPVQFGGAAQWSGSLHGRLNHPALTGHLVLHDFITVVRTGRKPGATEASLRTRWDLLEGDVEYSSQRESLRNGVLQRGGARIALDASVALHNGDYDSSQPFSAHLRLVEAQASDLQAILGSAYPISGRVAADVQVGGTSSHLNGSGRVSLHDGAAWGHAVRSASAQVNFTENQAQLRNIVVTSELMQLAGDARINVESREFAFDLKGTEVKLEKLNEVRDARLGLTGMAAFDVNGSGTPEAPVINGRLRLRNLALEGQLLGEMNVEAVTRGSEMTLTARSNFKNLDLKLDGQVHLREQMPMHLTADVQSSNLNPLLEPYIALRHSSVSEMKMHLEASGEARRPRQMTAEVTIERWATSYGNITVANDGPIRMRMANEVVHIEQFRLAAEQGARFLQVRGDVELAGKREIDLRASGSLDLGLLESADPNLMASGLADINMQANGTIERPLLRGRLTLTNASLAFIDFPNSLSDVNGTLVFNEDRLQVQELTARTGGGLLHCGGFVTYSEAQGLGFSLSATGRDIRLRYPEGLSSTATAAVTLTGSLKSAVLAGDITVTRVGLNPQFDFASYLVKEKRNVQVQKIETPLNNLRLDLHVTSTSELQVQTTLARLSGSIDLHLRGTAARPTVLGRVNLLEGQMYFNGTKFRMERGDITFTNAVRIDPALDIELTARVRDYDIALGFHGPLDRLTPSYRSDPPLSSSDIISLLALGRTAEEQANPAMLGSAQYSPTVSESASQALLGQALSATVSSRVQRLFGVSRLKIDPNVGGTTSAGLARVTVEQQVSRDITLTYITNLNQSAQQIIQFEYNISNNVSLVGVRDQTGVLSIDFLLRKRKK